MPRSSGNAMCPSRIPAGAQFISNFPGAYPHEDWCVHYWAVDRQGSLSEHQVTIELPQGYAEACPEIAIGEPGCICHVRRWGLSCYPSLLEQIGFDPYPLLPLVRDCGDTESTLMHIMIEAIRFDLPGHFVIASEQYPLLLFDPSGTLKGSYTCWQTHLGALAWMVSEGRVNGQFELMHKINPWFYEELVGYLRDMLKRGRTWRP